METMERKKPRARRSFTPEFKAEVVDSQRASPGVDPGASSARASSRTPLGETPGQRKRESLDRPRPFMYGVIPANGDALRRCR